MLSDNASEVNVSNISLPISSTGKQLRLTKVKVGHNLQNDFRPKKMCRDGVTCVVFV